MVRLLAAVAAAQLAVVDGCTVVAVGKDASASGSAMVAHTDDSGSDTTDIRLVRVPRKRWPKGSKRPLHNWNDGYPRVVNAERSPEYAPVHGQEETAAVAYIDQVEETYAYWDWDYGMQNEMGLSMGESTCTAKTVGWPATPDKAYGYNRAGIEDLSKLALERCATARCGVETMGRIAVEQGFYSADSGAPEAPDYMDSAEALVLADSNPGEVWIFNVMTGKNNASAIWAAQRVPSNHIVAVGNTFTIRKMNLSDSENFLYSPGVTELAEEMGWWKPEDDEPGVFDFMSSYGFTPPAEFIRDVLAFYSGRRMWRIFSLLSPDEGAKLDANKGNLPKTADPYPGSVPAPHGSVKVQDVMDVLRDHYEGTPYDLTVGLAAGPFGSPNRGAMPGNRTHGVWERAISMHRSSWSYVCEAKPGVLGGVSWVGLDAPHGATYIPFFGGAGHGAPETFSSHEGYQSKFSTKVAWWAFNLVNQYSDLNFKLINSDVQARAKEVDAESARVVAECEERASKSHRPQHEGARCLNSHAEKVVEGWWDLVHGLFAKYARYAITYSETNESMQVYPEWWLRTAGLGFTTWSARGPGTRETPMLAEAAPAEGAEGAVGGATVLLLATFTAVAGAVGYQLGARQSKSAPADAYIRIVA